KELDASIPTKSGLMLGHGETEDELVATMEDLRAVECDRITLGQYMRPSLAHLPVQRYWTPQEFDHLGDIARDLDFAPRRTGPCKRSTVSTLWLKQAGFAVTIISKRCRCFSSGWGPPQKSGVSNSICVVGLTERIDTIGSFNHLKVTLGQHISDAHSDDSAIINH
ncbi:MAG: hypothetical protein AAFX51_18365, partial [Cyanobacteria bacterium J06636_28]